MAEKNLKIALSLILAGLGLFLEVYYYSIRFENDGIAAALSWIHGASLSIMLAVAILNINAAKWIKALAGALIVYSVIATSAGQSFSLIQYDNRITTDKQKQSLTHEIIKEKEADKKDYQEKLKEVEKKLNPLGLWMRQNTYKEQADQLQAEKENYEAEIKKLSEEITARKDELIKKETIYSETKKPQTIYDFYNNLMLNVISSNVLQFIFQTIVSFFIAMMAPLGIISLKNALTVKEGEPEPVKKEKKPIEWDQLVEKWVRTHWTGCRTGRTKNILTKKTFMDYLSQKNESITEKSYDKIYAAATTSGAVLMDHIMIENEETAKNKILDAVMKGEKGNGKN